MRIRRLIVAAVIAGGVLFVGAPAAFAVDPGIEHGEHLVECVESALHDNEKAIKAEDFSKFENDLDNCRKAKSLFSVAKAELLWGTLAFAIVFFMLAKVGFPAIKKGLKAREDRIRGDLEAAASARTEAEGDIAKYRDQLASAQAEALRIVEEARVDADRVRRDLLTRAEADAAEVRARAQADSALAEQRAMADLRGRVAELSVDLAEKVVGRNLDRDTQLALVESYIDSVGNGSR